MHNNVIRWVVIFGAVALVGIIATQSYWVMTTWDLNEGEFNKKVNLALHRVANKLADLNQVDRPTREIVKQRTSNYWIVNMEVEIEDRLLEYLLQSELEALALNIDFEYAIYDCATNEMVYGGYCTYTHQANNQNLDLGNLPKDHEFTYYFGVKFPTRSGFLFDKMQLIIFLTAILLLTVLFFAYAIWVILRQKRLSEMQKDFINNMTHEFKTPLSTIKIAAGVFLNDEHIRSDPRLKRYASIIVEQNERLNKQVEKVLQIAKIEQGQLDLKREKVMLSEVLPPLLNSVQLQLDDLGGDLSTQLDHTECYLMADRLHLSNILYSLLDNAIKYRKDIPAIEVRTEVQDQQLTVTIADKGIGIEPAHQSQIFEKFYRVPTGNVHNVKGFGLGLYYVKRICDAHGWSIRLHSTPGEGTTIRLQMGPVVSVSQKKMLV